MRHRITSTVDQVRVGGHTPDPPPTDIVATVSMRAEGSSGVGSRHGGPNNQQTHNSVGKMTPRGRIVGRELTVRLPLDASVGRRAEATTGVADADMRAFGMISRLCASASMTVYSIARCISSWAEPQDPSCSSSRHGGSKVVSGSERDGGKCVPRFECEGIKDRC